MVTLHDEERAKRRISMMGDEIVIAFDDSLAFAICKIIKNLPVGHSRLGCGISRFYR